MESLRAITVTELSMLRNKSEWKRENWIINLFVLLCNFGIIISIPCSNGLWNVLWQFRRHNKLISASLNKFVLDTDTDLPGDWPCEWSNGTIPYVFDFFSVSPRRLMNLVQKGHDFLESRSCLKFEEQDPVKMANRENFTYLYYSYSGVLESCCLHYYSKPIGRRVILITPTCTLPAEVAHVTLHGMGLEHYRREPFPEYSVRAVLFPVYCPDIEQRIKSFGVA